MKAVFKTTAGSGGGSSRTGGGDGSGTSFPAGEFIFREGELGTEMFIIQEGTVVISKTLGGAAHVISTLERGDFFGEMAVLEHLPRTADAVASTDVRVIPINGSRFDEMLRRNPEIAVRIIRKYSQRLREANMLLERLAGRSLDELSNGSLERSTRTGGMTEDPPFTGSAGPRLVDLSTGEAFYMGAGEVITIGRADPVTGIRPDIDLSDVDANRSVSRRHAKIVKTVDGWAVLEEVGTVNGTFVNDQRVPSGVGVPLLDGDRVRIGLIDLRVILD